MEKQAAGKLVVVADNDKGGKSKKKVCLCGRKSPLAQRQDCIVAVPGTPWWNALHEAEPGETVTVHLPSKTLHLRVEEIQDVSNSEAA